MNNPTIEDPRHERMTPSGATEPAVRCLIVAPAPLGDTRIGGVANFIRGFVQYMPDDFVAEIVGVGVGDETPGSQWQSVSLAGRQVRFLPVAHLQSARRTGRMPVKARAVIGMLRARRRLPTLGRIVQVHAPAMELGLLGRRAPTIRVVHNAPEDLAAHEGESAWRRLGWVLQLAEQLTFRRADRVYFVNRATYERYSGRAGRAAAGMRYLPNGVDTTLFRPLSKDERTAARQRFASALDLTPDAPWLLFAGRLDPQKDPRLLLRAFAAARSSEIGHDAHLLIAGEGGLRTESERLAGDLGIARQVHFLGPWPHARLAELMPAVDAFVLSSAFEAGPTVVYEALAAGLPVVSTVVGEVPRLVTHRSTGWIADSPTADALAAGIEWALSQPFAEIAQRCAQSIAPYHMETILAPFYEDHRQLAASATRP